MARKKQEFLKLKIGLDKGSDIAVKSLDFEFGKKSIIFQ